MNNFLIVKITDDYNFISIIWATRITLTNILETEWHYIIIFAQDDVLFLKACNTENIWSMHTIDDVDFSREKRKKNRFQICRKGSINGLLDL